VYLEGAIMRQSMRSREHRGPRAVLNVPERLAGGYGSECERVRKDLGIAGSQLRDYQARLGKPFLHDAHLSELTSLREQLKAGLSATAHVQDDESGPSVSELAGKIKALKAADSIESTPQRERQKHSSAEEPVTARIRQRQEAHTAAGEAVQADGELGAGEALRPAAADSPGKPTTTFQERIAMERQNKDREPSLP
jgi:hypothetical protein